MPRLLTLALVAILLAMPARPASAQNMVGFAVITDTNVFGDTLSLGMGGISPAPPGSHYQGWLRAPDGSQPLDIGSIAVAEDGTVQHVHVSAQRQNLLGVYTVLEITIEPDGDVDPAPNGAVVFGGRIPDGIVPAARELLFQWSSSRFGTPSGQGLYIDALLLDRTAGEMVDAANAGDLDGAKRLAERLVNTVEGEGGANYGDHNGDGQAQGPGDGTGALNYAWGSYWRAKVAAANAPGDTWVEEQANWISASAELQIVPRLAELRDQGLAFQAVSDVGEAQQRAQTLREAASRVLVGFDANGDGAVDINSAEGGAFHVLVQGQYLAAIRIVPV